MLPSINAFSQELVKIAEEDKKSPGWEMLKILGAGTLGFGAGTLGGLAAGEVADRLSRHVTGKKFPKKPLLLMAPLLGTGAGIAYSIHKAKEQEAIRRALEDSTVQRQR